MRPRDASPPPGQDFDLPLYAELIDRLFANAISIGCMGGLFTAFGLLVAFRMHDVGIAGLILAASVASAAHLTIVTTYRGHPPARRRADLHRWEMRYAAAGFGSAGFLGLAAARTFLGDDLGSSMLMTGLIFGYAAGTMARAAVRPWITGPRIGLLVAAPIVALESRFDLLLCAQGLLLLLFLLTGLETMMTLHRQAVAEIDTSLRRHERALRDPLTGLANRLSLAEVLTERLAREADGRGLAVHCLDLDRFKLVNDTHGHPVGDLLLQAVARRLNALVRPDDLVARLGGDEFVVVQSSVAVQRDAERLASEIVEALRAPYAMDGRVIQAASSVGVAIATPDTRDVAALLAEADAALYASKSRGTGLYTISMGRRLRETERFESAS